MKYLNLNKNSYHKDLLDLLELSRGVDLVGGDVSDGLLAPGSKVVVRIQLRQLLNGFNFPIETLQ